MLHLLTLLIEVDPRTQILGEYASGEWSVYVVKLKEVVVVNFLLACHGPNQEQLPACEELEYQTAKARDVLVFGDFVLKNELRAA